jgi:hypothetical protein
MKRLVSLTAVAVAWMSCGGPSYPSYLGGTGGGSGNPSMHSCNVGPNLCKLQCGVSGPNDARALFGSAYGDVNTGYGYEQMEYMCESADSSGFIVYMLVFSSLGTPDAGSTPPLTHVSVATQNETMPSLPSCLGSCAAP